MDAELAARARSAGRRGRGRGARRRRRGRRPARSAAPPRARSGRAPASRRRRSARRGSRKPPRPSSSRASCWTFSRSCGALDEDVGDGEGVVEGERGVVAAGADLLGPDLARDVDQQAAAVALAVDVAGAVEHLLQGGDRQLDRLVARASRPCGPRRRSRRRPCPRRWAARPAGGRPLWRVALDAAAAPDWASASDLPVSAPSSSGRATGQDLPGLYGSDGWDSIIQRRAPPFEWLWCPPVPRTALTISHASALLRRRLRVRGHLRQRLPDARRVRPAGREDLQEPDDEDEQEDRTPPTPR